MKKMPALIVLLVSTALTVTACGNRGGSSDAGQQFNRADVTFAQGMVPHHRQATMMAEMAEERAQKDEVKDLAEEIIAAQDREIETMTGWLQEWGEEDAASSDGMDMPGMDHGDMGGMMSEEDMSGMRSMTGEEFDKMFLTMMIEHHEGAIEMAQTEQTEGENSEAIALAEKIEADQKAEIARMQDLLTS